MHLPKLAPGVVRAVTSTRLSRDGIRPSQPDCMGICSEPGDCIDGCTCSCDLTEGSCVCIPKEGYRH